MTDPRAPARPGFHRPAHHLLLYGGDPQFLAAALPFAREGLAAGEPVFIATTARNARLLQRHLGRQARQVDFAPPDWHRTPPQSLLAYHDRAHTAVGPSRVLGETPWLGLTSAEAREWSRFEALLTLALAATGAWHLCPYDTRTLPASILKTAHLTHPGLTSGVTHRPNPAHLDPEDFSAACDSVPLPEPSAGAAEFRFDGLDQLAAMRAFTRREARAAGLPRSAVENLLICVDEAAANALRHGGGTGRCRIWTTPTDLLCEVTDTHGTLNSALAGYLPPATAPLDGRGLWIIRQLSDAADMRSSDDGTIIRIRMRRMPPPEGPRLGEQPLPEEVAGLGGEAETLGEIGLDGAPPRGHGGEGR
ncbi:sensor histidine kinase [Streptomyces sp. A7024]|uniref:Sensor histidine kinase n=1 Tax=Streptomyces coryli TaxID=1128680 RepID=A0A6G4TSF1_9ACTN|nr:sensor histidine kinase [Streptomyces coryli]NGN62396.1 sensor histidine kinase [Streptomyces coryli]